MNKTSVLNLHKLYDLKHFTVYFAIPPLMKGHLILIPKSKVNKFSDLSPLEVSLIGKRIQTIGSFVGTHYDCEKFIIISCDNH